MVRLRLCFCAHRQVPPQSSPRTAPDFPRSVLHRAKTAITGGLADWCKALRWKNQHFSRPIPFSRIAHTAQHLANDRTRRVAVQKSEKTSHTPRTTALKFQQNLSGQTFAANTLSRPYPDRQRPPEGKKRNPGVCAVRMNETNVYFAYSEF